MTLEKIYLIFFGCTDHALSQKQVTIFLVATIPERCRTYSFENIDSLPMTIYCNSTFTILEIAFGIP